LWLLGVKHQKQQPSRKKSLEKQRLPWIGLKRRNFKIKIEIVIRQM
jgi:hypothetical protein